MHNQPQQDRVYPKRAFHDIQDPQSGPYARISGPAPLEIVRREP